MTSSTNTPSVKAVKQRLIDATMRRFRDWRKSVSPGFCAKILSGEEATVGVGNQKFAVAMIRACVAYEKARKRRG